MTLIIIHPKWVERFGVWPVAIFARELGMKLVQSADRKRLRMAKPTERNAV